MGLCGDCFRPLKKIDVENHFSEDTTRNRLMKKRRSYLSYTIAIYSIKVVVHLVEMSLSLKVLAEDDIAGSMITFLLAFMIMGWLLDAFILISLSLAFRNWKNYQLSVKLSISALLATLIFPLLFVFVPIGHLRPTSPELILTLARTLGNLYIPNILLLYTACLGIFRTRKLFESDPYPLFLVQLVLTLLLISIIAAPAFIAFQALAACAEISNIEGCKSGNLEYLVLLAYIFFCMTLIGKTFEGRIKGCGILNIASLVGMLVAFLLLLIRLHETDVIWPKVASLISTFAFNRLAYQDATIFLFRHMEPIDVIWDDPETESGEHEMEGFQKI